MNLFQIDEQLQRCVKLESSDNYVDTETGEIIDTAAIEQLEMDRDTKIRNIACWIVNLKSDITALKAQEKTFKERRESAERKMESLKSYLSAFLAGKKWENSEVKISWRKSDAVTITDINKLSKYYLKYRKLTEDDFNKTIIKTDLKAGVVVDGAVLAEKNNIQIK